ncbi:MAG: type 1 glutamine amidotransferase domain-containing protein [bacterium]
MGKIEGKRVVFLVGQEFEDIELLYPLLRLSEEGAKTVIVAVDTGLHPRPAVKGKYVTGRFGTTVPPLVHEEGRRYTLANLEEIDSDKVDAIVIPGGFSPDALRIHQGCLDLVRSLYEKKKIVAAICHGPQVLISAGIVRGKSITSYEAVKDDLINAGANYKDSPVVVDGNIVTSRVPDDLPDFCLKIIEKLIE